MIVISEDESEEHHDRATVDTDSFKRGHGQLGSNVAENAISYLQLSKWNSTNISMLTCTTTVQNFNFICAVVIKMYEYTSVNFKAVFLRIFFCQMTRCTFSLSNNNSATNRAW